MVQLTTTRDSTVFTCMASTLALSSFPTLGSFQQCGQLLRGECQDGSTLGVLPCLRALPQGLQGEGPIAGAISAHPCATRVQLRLPYQLEILLEENAARLWLHRCRRTWRIIPGQKNRKDQLVLTPELPCLDWCPPPISLPPPSPDSLTLLPPHNTHFLRLFSAWIYGVLGSKEMCNTRSSVYVCLSVYP